MSPSWLEILIPIIQHNLIIGVSPKGETPFSLQAGKVEKDLAF